ncbi:MAG: M23 family metallopeptidase [Actinomycetota bacterium]
MPFASPVGRRAGVGVRAGGALFAALILLSTSCSPDPDSTPASAEDAHPAPPQEVAPASPEPAPPAPRIRQVSEQNWTPFATVGGIFLMHPSQRVERVAFHEANHDGARQMDALPTAAAPVTLQSRERSTGSRSAADIVSDPAGEIRSVVTGTVIRSGSYVLYCDYTDYFVVIEPEAHPGWEVKMLHMAGINVAKGDRVIAGTTVVAPRPARLAFESQVDELTTGQVHWPHVHVEVVDPSIPNRPSPGGGC